MVPPPASHGASAMQAFNDGTGQNGRRVKIDYSQSAAGTGSRNGRNQNDGTRDIGNTPSPVVLLRGLDPISTLDIISEALKSSAGTTGQGAVGMKRIILIRDNFTAMGIGLAFVEFIDTESASQTLAATMSRELHPEGFRISNRPVATSFASPSSFQPLAPHSLRDGACIMGSTAMGGVEGVFAKYWDDNTTVVEMAFQASTAPVVPVAPTPRPAVASVKADLAPSLIADDDPDLEFCILEKFTCYLCARQLKSQEQLKRHVKESDLHKKNLLNEALQETAREKVAKVRGTNDTSTAGGGAKSVYRDRASERRVIHGQPDAPLPEPSRGIGAGSAGPGQGAGSKKIKDVPLSPPAPPTPPPKEPAKDENNIGNKLLKKMGWSEGTGLGLSGEGRVDPIQTAIYASGAGLGASKGRDITRVAGLDYAGLTKESVSRP
ncbi:hypothetical protein FS842_008332 [Serendipita sp. 407]|nr:hypothetical protein FS842_008332 [Serendipita sp. 407]